MTSTSARKVIFHVNPDAEEYLLCMKGTGLVMFLSRDGECWCEELEEGSLHKIPSNIGRRLINTGDEPLMLSQCLPSNAGLRFRFNRRTSLHLSCL